MTFHSSDLDELSKYMGIPISDLKNKSFSDIEVMIKNMRETKITQQNSENANSSEYSHLVIRFFKPLKFLRHWFSEREIVLACAYTGVTERDLCSEQFVEPGTGRRFWETHGEYLRTSIESVRQFDNKGRELLLPTRKQMDVYRVSNQYQHLIHGKVIKYLLYGRYPKLETFGFAFYGTEGDQDYEIYPNGSVYISFTALMSGDVDWILFRNREYAKWFNNGCHTPKECEKALHAADTLEMFDMIHQIGEHEKYVDHTPVTIDENNRHQMANGLKETKISVSGDVRLMEKERRDTAQKNCFKLYCTEPYNAAYVVNEFISMVGNSSIDVHIYHTTDYLGEHGIHIKNLKTNLENAENISKYSQFLVKDTFGWNYNGKYDLTIRIECPELMEE